MAPAVLPSLLAIASGVLMHWMSWAPVFGTPAEAGQFGGTVASVGVTMLGFMLAALAVLASINHTQLVAMMRRTGHYSDLLSTLFIGSSFFLMCAVAGYALLFGMTWRAEVITVVVALHIGALACLLDVGRKFWLVLTNLNP